MKLVQRVVIQYYKTKFRFWALISRKLAAEKIFDLFCTPPSRHQKKPPRFFRKAEPLHFTLDHFNVQVRGWRWNHPSEKRALILHGFESSAANFDRYIKPLVRKGFEVIAFDAPAHGRSGGKRITAIQYKEMIREIYLRYGPVQSFLAHSFGGLAVCLAMEEINHDESFRLVLIAPATETGTAVDSFFRFLEVDPTLKEEFENVIIKKSGKNIAWFSINRAMENIRAAVRWFHDEEDNITPLSDALKVKDKNLSNVEFVISKGLGHRNIYRDNKVTRSAVDFIAGK